MSNSSPTVESRHPSQDGNGQPRSHDQSHGDENALPADLPKPSNLTVTLVVVALAIVLVALFLIGWIPYHRQQALIRSEAQAHASEVPVVGVAHPKPAETSKDLFLPCDVRANQQTDIYPRANGYLRKWYVDIQAHVDAGQVLADIDAPDIDAQLAQSRAQLELNRAGVGKAEADLKLADITLKRYIQAQKNSPGSVTQEDVDTRQSTYDDAIAALAQARASVAASQANVQQLTVQQGFEKVPAPFAGIITARNYDNGALLNPSNSNGRPLFSLAQTDVLRVFVSVPQTYATNIKDGQTAMLEVRNYPGRQFEGTVARNSGAINPTTRTLTVEVDFQNKNGDLFPGMYGSLHLPITQEAPVITVPTSALVFNASGLQVGVVKDNKVHIQKVTVGRDLGTEIEVTAGVTTEDLVITNPGERVGEGVQVKVNMPENQATAEKTSSPTTRTAAAD